MSWNEKLDELEREYNHRIAQRELEYERLAIEREEITKSKDGVSPFSMETTSWTTQMTNIFIWSNLL